MTNVSENNAAGADERYANPKFRRRIRRAERSNTGNPESSQSLSTTAKQLEFLQVAKDYPSTKQHKAFTAITDFSLNVNPGEFVSIVGPSGCGKSTLLSLMAGLSAPTKGEVTIDGHKVDGIRHDVGYVLQQDSLLPWRTVIDQVALALEYRGVDKKERKDRARQWTSRVGLANFENSYPHQLSGGMRKRVAIAASLVYDPDVILMDEPFGALDSQTRLILQNDLISLWQAGEHQTVLFVTHDLEEAIGLSDRVVLMSAGPGRLIGDYRVDLSRPRDLMEIKVDPIFTKLYSRIWSDLREEVLKSNVMFGATSAETSS
jgi:NitT/TauT family transport system ATP-binding protein